MIKCIDFKDRVFSTKEELFAELRANKQDLIKMKCSQELKSCEKGIAVYCKPIDVSKYSEANKGLKVDDNYWYIAMNTTNVLDSHGDLHVDGIWDKTKKDSNFKNYIVDSHVMSINTTIAKAKHVEIMTVKIPFRDLGFDYDGMTEVLLYKVPKDKVIHQKAKEWLESGDPIEGSVRMIYIKISLALNSDAKEDIEEKKTYVEYYPLIANKAAFKDIPYYWVIKEARNIGESSLVLNGSNPVTGIYYQKELKENDEEPLKDTLNNDTESREYTFDKSEVTRILKNKINLL